MRECVVEPGLRQPTFGRSARVRCTINIILFGMITREPAACAVKRTPDRHRRESARAPCIAAAAREPRRCWCTVCEPSRGDQPPRVCRASLRDATPQILRVAAPPSPRAAAPQILRVTAPQSLQDTTPRESIDVKGHAPPRSHSTVCCTRGVRPAACTNHRERCKIIATRRPRVRCRHEKRRSHTAAPVCTPGTTRASEGRG